MESTKNGSQNSEVFPKRLSELEIFQLDPLNTIHNTVRVTKMRWVVLFIFVFIVIVDTCHYVGFVMVPQVFTVYFEIDIGLISWTVQIYGVVFCLLIFPLMAWTKESVVIHVQYAPKNKNIRFWCLIN